MLLTSRLMAENVGLPPPDRRSGGTVQPDIKADAEEGDVQRWSGLGEIAAIHPLRGERALNIL